MENKKALLVYGEPRAEEDSEKFRKDASTDLDIMKSLSVKNGYDYEVSHMNSMEDKLKQNKGRNFDDFLFYFVGHAGKDYLGSEKYKTNDLLCTINSLEGKKKIFLDACAGNYEGGENFEALNLPENSKVLTFKESYPNKSLAKLLYGLDIMGSSFDKINQESINNLKQGDLYYSENSK